MILISHINKLFILLLLSIGATSPSYAGLFDDWTDNQLCEWMDQPSPPEIIQGLVYKRLIGCSEGIAKKWGEASNTLDGSYSFKLSRFNPSEGSFKLGSGILEISDGKISVAKKSRSLTTSSTSYYDTFEGQINKEGNIIASFEVNALHGKGNPRLVGFTGSMDELQIKGKFDDYFEMIIKFNKKAKQIKTTKTTKATKVATSDSDPTVSKVIEVIHGDTFIVDIAEPHELAGSNIKLIIRDANTPDATKSCPKQMELGIKVKDIVSQKLADASSIKLKKYRKTSKAVIAQVIVDGKDLGEELIEKGYASDEYGYWKAYFCSALTATQAGMQLMDVDSDKSIFWFERAIVLDPEGSNNSQSTFLLSVLYSRMGNSDKSLEYLKQSANLGSMQAEEALGEAYMNGNGVSKDPAQAKKWLKKAYEHGSKDAEDICGCEF